MSVRLQEEGRVAGPMAVAAVVPVTGVRRHSDDRGVGALARLDGRTLLAHALASLEASPSVTAIVVVTPPEAEAAAKAVAAERVVVAEAFVVAEGFVKVTAVVPGGPTRQGSVALGLAALPPGPELVAVHEAARPLAGPDLLGALLERLLAGLVPGVPAGDGPGAPAGVVPGVPVVDTVRRVGEGGRSRGIVDRGRLRSIQTPQLFIRAVLAGSASPSTAASTATQTPTWPRTPSATRSSARPASATSAATSRPRTRAGRARTASASAAGWSRWPGRPAGRSGTSPSPCSVTAPGSARSSPR